MRFAAIFSIVTMLLFFASCSFVPHALLNAPKNPQPLPDSIPILFINAAKLPILPQEHVYLGTIRTGASSGCSDEGTINYLHRLARKLGANIVYVKESDVRTVYYYTQFGGSQTSECLTLVADFLYSDAPLFIKWQEEVMKTGKFGVEKE